MKKSQYNKDKKYRFKRTKVFSIKNITRVAVIVAIFCSVGYSYWNTTLHITGTVTAVGNPSSQASDTYDPDNLVEGTNTFDGSPGKPTVTVENGVVKEYTITESVDINANPIDTGFLPFTNGKNFQITMTATFIPDENKTQGGVLFDVSDGSNTNLLRIAYPVGTTYPKFFVNSSSGKNISLVDNAVTLTITYENGSGRMQCNQKNYNINTSFNLENARFLLGYMLDSDGNPTRQAVSTITQFSIKEI